MMRRPTNVARAAAVLATLFAAVGVASASADGLPSSPPQQYRASTQSADVASRGYDGSGTTVAVIDSGVANVAGLDGKVIAQKNLSAAPDSGDQFGHGTFVAGLVHEAAPGASIVSVKLSGANGSVDVTQVLAALQWVVLNKERYSIDVVNLSFGNDSKQSTRLSPLNYAVQRAWDAGIVVVASAGNAGNGPGTVTKPGDDPLIISVGASDEHGTVSIDNDDIPSFVSRGPTVDGLAKPDLVAPGSHVVSLRAPGSTIDVAHPEARVGDDGFRGSGTSFAAPIVAGVAAQLLQADPSLTPNEVKAAMLRSAKRISGDPAARGAGTLQASKALSTVTGSTGSTPPPDDAAVEVTLSATTGDAEVGVDTGVDRSSGTGSLDGARGSALVKVLAPVRRLDGSLDDVPVTLTGERTAEVAPPSAAPTATLLEGLLVTATQALDPLDRSAFLDKSLWQASTWGASTWGASTWGASTWGASTWGASTWGASTWGASQWWASTWG